MDGGALACPIEEAATAVAPTTDNTMIKVVRLATGLRGRWRRGLLGMCLALLLMVIATASAKAEFGIEPGTFSVGSFAADGVTPVTQAGARPFQVTTKFQIKYAGPEETFISGYMRNLDVKLPRGLIGNAEAVTKCPRGSFDGIVSGNGSCPISSQVGVARIEGKIGGAGITTYVHPVYNVEPKQGQTVDLGLAVSAVPVHIIATVDSSGDYQVKASVRNLSQGVPVLSSELTLWGVPGDPAHNAFRSCDGTDRIVAFPPCVTTLDRTPFMTNPTECGGPMTSSITVDSWEAPGVYVSDTYTPSDPIQGCEDLDFKPSIKVASDSPRASVPASYTVDIDVPQNDDPNGLGTPPVRDVTVTMPEGTWIAAGAADGLKGCTDAQIALKSDAEPTCPEASKIGRVTVKTPLLPKPMEGEVFIGQPLKGNLFRMFLTLRGPGLLLKLPGTIDPDPVTGRVTTKFLDNPPLPFSNFQLVLKGGPRSPLSNPSACGAATTTASMTAWGVDTPAVVSSSFDVTQSSDGAPCGPRGFAPSFLAGVENAAAGSSSPFSLAVARQDSDKELKTIKSVRLPEGLLGNVGSVPVCGEAQAAAGTCPESSRIGHVQAALGAGSSPLWVPQAGKSPTAVYLAGPYKRAPYSLSIVVPAQAGPFDFGKVVVRSALHVDERTTAITTGIDETRLIDVDGTVTEVLPEALPRILEGVVLNQRELRVIMDRDDFMVNPTDCSVKEITAEIYSVDGDRANVGNRFRAADCALLGFKPKFSARILDKGRKSTLKSFHPRTKFTVVPRKGDANIGGARVVLPSSTLLDQANIGTTCTRAQMAERKCPEASIVGYAKAWSPLLRRAVEGPVYLAANGGVRPLPDLAAVMDGEIRVVLQGEVSTLRTGGKARLQNTFRVVPDAPVNRFELTMRGGAKRGLLVNSTDLCRTRERGVAVFNGQNGRQHKLRPRILTSFKGCGKVRRRANRQMRSGGGSA